MEKQNTIHQIRTRTAMLNNFRDRYYNYGDSPVTDAEYDRLLDELAAWEKDTGFVLANSPTQTVGYRPVGELAEVQHVTPLLSLKKQKSLSEIIEFIGVQPVSLMLKLDGLTTKLEYEDGKLVRCSTRGDGRTGDDVTHNACAISGIPSQISYLGRLVVSGETFIHSNDFENLVAQYMDAGKDAPKTPRNLAAGSIRTLDPAKCAERHLCFIPFRVIEGLEGDSKWAKLLQLTSLGFELCFSEFCLNIRDLTPDSLMETFEGLRCQADVEHIPIDGIVITYDSISYSDTCTPTGSKYNDGIAFKWDDDAVETIFRDVEWNTTRSGLISPVALFDPVEIEGTMVSRATLHNLTILEGLRLAPGCRIEVTKRNMIIPHVERNLEPQDGGIVIPGTCPCCGEATEIAVSDTALAVKNVFCRNEKCASRHLSSFLHFVSRKAMDIEGLSESTLERFIGAGWLKTFPDIYHLDEHREEIIALDRFGEKSYERLWVAIEASRNTTFEKFVISCDIPLIGRHASAILATKYNCDLDAFAQAAMDGYFFSRLDGIGMTLQENIHNWFKSAENLSLWNNLKKEVTIMNANNNQNMATQENPFTGKTVVVTGTLPSYTRGEIEGKLYAIGAKPTSSVSKKTNYVLAGEKAGSKLTKAQNLGVTIINEQQFHAMLGE